MKIDVCLVTKKSKIPQWWLKNLERVPLNNLIVETSTPLAMARMRAIQKVQTEWFAFIDDDVVIGKRWIDQVTKAITPKTGAVETYLRILAPSPWQYVFDERFRRLKSFNLKLGQRGYTVATLIKTDLVRDWKPSRKDLTSFEDYELTQHVLKKGYAWTRIPAEGFHDSRSAIKLWRQSVWAIEGEKKATRLTGYKLAKNTIRSLWGIAYNFGRLFYYFLYRRKNIYQIQYSLFISTANLFGWMFA